MARRTDRAGREIGRGSQRWPRRSVPALAGAGLILIVVMAGPIRIDRPVEATLSQQGAPVYDIEVIQEFPHDPRAYTQGLSFDDAGRLFEGTGSPAGVERSELREVDLETGKVLRSRSLDPAYFGEGVAVWKDKIVQLTWQSRVGFIYRLDPEGSGPEAEPSGGSGETGSGSEAQASRAATAETGPARAVGVGPASTGDAAFPRIGRFRYDGEGWGVTHDGTRVFLSDGTNVIRVLDPEKLEVRRRITVTDAGRPISRINELEYINGRIWANLYQTDYLVAIDPGSGRVVAWVDLAPLRDRLTPAQRRRLDPTNDVLNGIAFDPKTRRLYVTGKRWPKLFQVRLVSGDD